MRCSRSWSGGPARCASPAIARLSKYAGLAEGHAHFGIARVEPKDQLELDVGLLEAPGGQPDLPHAVVGVCVGGLKLQHAAELLGRLGQAVELDQEVAELDERVDVARIVAQLVEVQLHGPLGLA